MTDLARFDDWQNTVAGFGTIRDKHTATTFAPRMRLDRQRATWIYEQSWLAARIVDRVVDDAFRSPWRFKSIDADVSEAEIHSRLAEWKLAGALRRFYKWGRLHGGALMLFPTLGTGKPSEPMDLRNPSRLLKPWVVTCWEAVPLDMDVGFGSDTFQEILSYDVTGLLTPTVCVHASRTIKHEPIDLPIDALLQSPNRWGPSVLERPLAELQRDGAAAGHAIAMMYVASILWIKLQGLRREGTSREGKARVRAILAEARGQLDALGILGLDAGTAQQAGDEIGNLSVQATSVHELARLVVDRVAACVDGMPREILLNEAPTGLRGGELSGAQAIWNGTVDAFRRNVIEPDLDRCLEIAFACWGIKAENWTYEWDPIFRPGPAEEAAVSKTTAEADAVALEYGVVSPAELREHRHVQGHATGPVRLSAAAPEPIKLPEAEVEAYQAAASEPPDVAAEAMNGAQVDGLIQIAEKVAAGTLPRDAAVAIIRVAYPTAAAVAELVVGPAVAAGPAPGPEADGIGQAPIEPGDRIRIQEAAARYGVPTAAITAAIRRGELRAIGIGSHRIVSISEVHKLATEGPPAPPSEPAPEVGVELG